MAVKSDDRNRLRLRWHIPVLAWFIFCAIGLLLDVTNRFPMAFDELEHVSYAAFLQETHRWFPKFEDQQTLSVDDLSHWTDRPNYLGHPSPFYDYVSMFLDRTLAPDRAVLPMRLASFTLMAAGAALALAAGWRAFRRDSLAATIFCLLIALCPKLLAVSGQVNNDALGFLGGAVAYWATEIEGRRRWLGTFGAAAGLMFALWSKPNAGLAVGAWLGLFALLRAPPHRRLIFALIVAGIVGTAPYWFILHDYGKLVPVTVEQFGHVRQLDGFASFVPAFLINLAYTWCYFQPGTWPIMHWASYFAAALVWLLLGAAFVGGYTAFRHGRSPRDVVAIAGVFAFAVMLPIHFWFSATRLGFSLPATSFRYYLPLWPPLAHAVSYAILNNHWRWQRYCLSLIAIVALIVGWISPS